MGAASVLQAVAHREWTRFTAQIVARGRIIKKRRVPHLRAVLSGAKVGISELASEGYCSYPPAFFSIFAHVSLSGSVRLNTSAPGLESRSAQK